VQALPAGPRYLSLQLTLGERDQALLKRRPDVLHLGAEQQDMPDNAAPCQCCDVVLTMDTSMAHLAGALGRPTWVALHASADWRRGVHLGIPPCASSRQHRWDDWCGPLQEVARALTASHWAPDNAAR
jgi:ADP-heptose:LPS heptosyltransferase